MEELIRYSSAMLKRFAVVKILFALFLAVALLWERGAIAQTNAIYLPLKCRQLTGMKVENSDGQRVGTVRNLVLDMKTGRVRYVVIGSGAFLGLRATLKIAPSRAVSAATAKRQTLAVNATTTQWNQAPVFKLSDLLSLAEPNHTLEISHNFGTSPPIASMAGTNSLSTTGRETGTNSSPPELIFASDLIGMRVVNPKHEKTGEVVDLLVSFGDARPAFAIISSGRLFRREHQYAVPLSELSLSVKESKLTLNADTPALQQAPPFNQQIWETGARKDSSQVYSYSTAED